MENNRDKAFPCGDKLHKPATERLTDGNNLSFIRRNPMPNHQRMIPRLFNLLLQKTVFQCMLCDNGSSIRASFSYNDILARPNMRLKYRCSVVSRILRMRKGAPETDAATTFPMRSKTLAGKAPTLAHVMLK